MKKVEQHHFIVLVDRGIRTWTENKKILQSSSLKIYLDPILKNQYRHLFRTGECIVPRLNSYLPNFGCAVHFVVFPFTQPLVCSSLLQIPVQRAKKIIILRWGVFLIRRAHSSAVPIIRIAATAFRFPHEKMPDVGGKKSRLPKSRRKKFGIADATW